MEVSMSLSITKPRFSLQAFPVLGNLSSGFSIQRPFLRLNTMDTHYGHLIRAQLSESTDGLAPATPAVDSGENSLRDDELEFGKFQNEVATSQGIKIRRRPPTGPPQHYVGPFEFRLQNEGNTPRNILEEIIWAKHVEVSQLKERRPLLSLKSAVDSAPPIKDFIGVLKASYLRTGLPGLIAEVKKASPSRGVLRENFDPVEIARAYEKGGAACLSVLTDEKYFQGSFENMEAIRNAGIKCPILCKEFIIDAWQIYYARSKGADAILLIAAVLPDLDIRYMSKICKMLGLATLVEVHNEREMDRVLGIEGVQLIGINNRNLETFEVDISNTKKLLEGERGELIRQKDIIGEHKPFKPYTSRYHVPYKSSSSTSPLWYSIKRASAYIIILSSYSAYGKYTPQYKWLENELPKYVDPLVTPKACAGLNGMKLGGKVLIAVQATPNAQILV